MGPSTQNKGEALAKAVADGIVDAQERAALERMVQQVLGCPDLMEIAHQFAERSLEATRKLPASHPDRIAYDADFLTCRAGYLLRDVLAISRALRMRIRDAGPLPSSVLDSWQPPEGATQ